ncbi:MAG: pyridoxamine 5'-phosphate oxidase family protein [Prolixibacteraceae bacterium]|nr:pyridoxamine 5'-phosphate oxidase family protein [Prolixibacteraceae bacterium]
MRTLIIEERKKIYDIIKSCQTCFLAMSHEDAPYLVPMNFALTEDTVILHSAQNGRLWNTLHKNPKVCISWLSGEDLAWQDESVGCSYRVKSKSVIAEGQAEFIDDYNEKERCLHMLMKQYSKRDFKFNPPAVKNVGIMKVRIEKISAKEFGAKAVTPWKQ